MNSLQINDEPTAHAYQARLHTRSEQGEERDSFSTAVGAVACATTSPAGERETPKLSAVWKAPLIEIDRRGNIIDPSQT